MTSAKVAPNASSTKSKADPVVKSPDLTLDCLRVDHSVVAKELAKFRACEPATRTLYCREWAQFIYKRHFAYNSKTQEEMSQLRTISGPGGYKLCVGGPSSDTREVASIVCTRISKLMETYFSETQRSTPPGEFLSSLLSECESWQKLPNSMSWLPDYFDPIVFDSFPDAIPLPEDPKDPSQLLDAIIIDKTSLSLPSSSFHLLKNLKAEVLASQSQAICGHRKPMAKTPADLDTERKIFTDKFEKVTNTVFTDIQKLLQDVWKDLNATVDGLRTLMADWRKEMGPDLVMLVSEFCRNNRDKLVGFNEYWGPYAETFKKKKNTTSVEEIDNAFYQYIDNARDAITLFDKEFMTARYTATINLVQNLQTLCGAILAKQMEDMKTHGVEKFHKAVLDSCSTARNFVLKPEHLEHVQDNVENVKEKMKIMLKELYDEVDSVKEQYEKESQKNVFGRLEKLAHKEFKKRLKKLEVMQQSLRQTFTSEFATNVFPEQQFAQLALVTLISVMQEGEQMECDAMDDFMFDFVDDNEELLAQRDDLILDFEEGVHTGRTQLSGLIGKLYLKEGMRIQGDSLALKRQNNLLKSMGLPTDTPEEPTASPPTGSGGSKKKKKKKKNANTNTNADNEEVTTDVPATAEVVSTNAVPAKVVGQTNGDDKKASTSTTGSKVAAVATPSVISEAAQSEKPTGKSSQPINANNQSSSVNKVPSVNKQTATMAATQPNTGSKANVSKVAQATVSKSPPFEEKSPINTVESPPKKTPCTNLKDKKADSAKPKVEATNTLAKSKETVSKNKSKMPPASSWVTPPVAPAALADDQKKSEKQTDNAWPSAEPTAPLWGEKPNITFNKGAAVWDDSEKKAQPVTGKLWGQQLNSQDVMDQSGWDNVPQTLANDWSSKPNQQPSKPSLNAQVQNDTTQHPVLDVHEQTEKGVPNFMKQDPTFQLSNTLEDQDKQSEHRSEQGEWDMASSMEKSVASVAMEVGSGEMTKSAPHLPPGLQMAPSTRTESSSAMHDNLAHQHPDTLVSVVQSLQVENAQLVNALLSVQQELNTMNARYGELVTLAREREAQKALEMEEARRYILKLEAKVHLLEPAEGSHFDVSRRNMERESNSGRTYSNDEFAGQGREDRHRRQPLSKPRHQSSSSAVENHDRDRKRINNMWRDSRVIKCGNCGEAGHKSSDCQDACRYCGSKAHLSESCELIV
ncbi:hypothetical protein K450DRAFT_244923 [Umbelopsis ramanniana AG]|uniref:CCHC-type domain-containing protein n=1 Tax=Umbelopsis ramanniana AG TaxID=1314678 RepID=A0AAD5E8W3_UMBRA|nr:uncharacterized protein K450DRAFT_244923 [Umbelopsis ramanniana AG]KAI8578877.1 hypothetical protein K450DRAFT_244923 [Umbelopsis ramanniana AG]